MYEVWQGDCILFCPHIDSCAGSEKGSTTEIIAKESSAQEQPSAALKMLLAHTQACTSQHNYKITVKHYVTIQFKQSFLKCLLP